MNQINVSGVLGSGDALYPGQWYEANTYYQILKVEPAKNDELARRKGQNIKTTILARKRNSIDTNQPENDSFDSLELDRETIEKLRDYPRKGDENKLSSYLPFPGAVFPTDFIKTLCNDSFDQTKLNQTELGNFYPSMRVILQGRKLSQLIARTWWTYLEAKKTDDWNNFTNGEWDKIRSEILDGLIAREIFLFAGSSPPDNPNPDDKTIYEPLKAQDDTSEGARFLILPTSRAWQGITLSLLSSGQAYYYNEKEGKYHQVAESILSTGEIVFNYSLEVDWTIFQGQFKESITSQESPWMLYQVAMPYPPIPSSEQLDPSDIKKWAEAPVIEGEFPFYKKKNRLGQEVYLIDVDYFKPPYPYIPVSSS
ncbi:hypothetical protein [Nostoc sp. NMS4]|uniref:hypothetical protein n=1 Tax=Nostoc sp. NMS4 TaxID=2815390 RepID=UPI0025F3AC71|nr:hypothetical protein [Nostoc sp. NMS4]MBN3921912.1 hypothetical protein [Nostoc sp. NMS4]